MRSRFYAVLFAAVSFAAPALAQDSAPTAELGPVHPAIVALAKEWFYRFQKGDIDRSQLDTITSGELTNEMIRNESAMLKRFGRPLQFAYLGKEEVSYATGYVFGITFINGRVIEHIAFDPS